MAILHDPTCAESADEVCGHNSYRDHSRHRRGAKDYRSRDGNTETQQSSQSGCNNLNISIKPGEHIIALGKTGSGKTYYLKNGLLKSVHRVLIIDTEDMEFDEYALAKGDPKHVVKHIPKPEENNYRWRVVPPKGNKVEFVDSISGELLDAENARHSWIVFEEVTDYSDAYSIPDNMRDLIRKARKRNITVALTSQRTAGINKWLWENASHKFIFYTDEDEIMRMKRNMPYTAASLLSIDYGTHNFIYVGPDGKTHLIEHL